MIFIQLFYENFWNNSHSLSYSHCVLVIYLFISLSLVFLPKEGGMVVPNVVQKLAVQIYFSS